MKKIIFALVVLSSLVSCVNTMPVERQVYVKKDNKNTGCVFASFVATGIYGILPNLRFQQVDGKLTGFIHAPDQDDRKVLKRSKPIVIKSSPFGSDNRVSVGGIVMYDLPVGHYVIQGFEGREAYEAYDFGYRRGVQIMKNSKSLDIRFSVVQGKCTYIGAFNWIGSRTNAYRFYFGISDEYQRDLRLFRKKYPGKITIPVRKNNMRY